MNISDIIIAVLKIIGLAIATEAFTEIATSSDLIAPWKKKWKLWTYPPNVEPSKDIVFSDKLKRFIDALWSCGYCFSVWVAGAFAFLGMYPSDISIWWCIPWWVVNWMMIHRLSNWVHILFELIKRGRVRTYDLILRIDEVRVAQAGDELVVGDEDESAN